MSPVTTLASIGEQNTAQFQTTITEEIEAIMDVFERAELVRKQMNAQALADGIAEGIEKGSIRGERKMLLVVIEARGLALSDTQRSLIELCEDHDALARWTRNAVTASDGDAVFR